MNMQTTNQKIETLIYELKTDNLRKNPSPKQQNIESEFKHFTQSMQEQTAQLASSKLSLIHQNLHLRCEQRSFQQKQRSCRRSCCRHRQRIFQAYQPQQKPQKIIHWKKWTSQQQQLFCKFIGIYGSDFTFLQSLFPQKTRKQLKKKYQQVHKSERWIEKIDSIQRQIIRQKRKQHFDRQIMSQNTSISSSSQIVSNGSSFQ